MLGVGPARIRANQIPILGLKKRSPALLAGFPFAGRKPNLPHPGVGSGDDIFDLARAVYSGFCFDKASVLTFLVPVNSTNSNRIRADPTGLRAKRTLLHAGVNKNANSGPVLDRTRVHSFVRSGNDLVGKARLGHPCQNLESKIYAGSLILWIVF